jgi:CheY-like chemotaxis protein
VSGLPETELTRRHVLVVDDEPALRGVLGKAFAAAGLVVDLAGDGREALAILEQRCPNAIVCDVSMPVMDGLEFLNACRALPCCADVPMILMSAEERLATVRQQASDKGVVLFMAKPFDLDLLIAAVLRLTLRG